MASPCLSGCSPDGAQRSPEWAAPAFPLRSMRATAALLLPPPHFLGELDNLAHLRPLLVFGEDVAFLGAGEAALRTQGKLLQRGEFRRLVDAPLDVVGLLQRSGFRRDQAEHHDLVALGQ